MNYEHIRPPKNAAASKKLFFSITSLHQMLQNTAHPNIFTACTKPAPTCCIFAARETEHDKSRGERAQPTATWKLHPRTRIRHHRSRHFQTTSGHLATWNLIAADCQ
jgi:hypothetical protein